jgi:hypothetical protein
MLREDRPVASGIVLCDNVINDPDSGKLTLEGVFIRIIAEQFPLIHPFWAYLRLYDFVDRGRGSLLVTIKRRTGEALAGDDYQQIQMGPGLTDVREVLFRIDNCTFPREGLYWVEFYWNENKVAECPLQVVRS